MAAAVMTSAAITRRLAEIEAELAALQPQSSEDHLPPEMEWVAWLTFAELDRMEEIYWTALEQDDRDLTGPEKAEVLAIQAMAISRQLAGGPPYVEDMARYDRTDRS
jgi:hypothetical protein